MIMMGRRNGIGCVPLGEVGGGSLLAENYYDISLFRIVPSDLIGAAGLCRFGMLSPRLRLWTGRFSSEMVPSGACLFN